VYLDQQVPHEHPPVFFELEDKGLILALSGLLPDRDTLFVTNDCFVSFYNAFLAQGVAAQEMP